MPMSLELFTRYFGEVQNQPSWRRRADREMEYVDGNQLDAEILQRQRDIGIPPAIEPLIGPTLRAVQGAEVKSRTKWKTVSDVKGQADDLAEAMSQKLFQAERKAGVQEAISDAYLPQIAVGLGWVEVSRETDPFKYPYRTMAVHRNEIWWDFLDKSQLLDTARYLIRRRWTDASTAALMFPDKADLINHSVAGWGNFLMEPTTDGGSSTDLAMSFEAERGWSVEEQEWRNIGDKRVCLFEVWYREWDRVLVLKLPSGRVAEYDDTNPVHVAAVAAGAVTPEFAIVSRVRLAWFCGPHMLSDGPSPYRHAYFPYVPFWGMREDRTNAPYALARGMMYLQDEVNARISRMQWGLAAVRTIRTDGAVAMEDEQLRQEIARPDADIVLSAEKMSMPGARFEVQRDFQLNEQQASRLIDAREGIKRTAGVYDAFMGQGSPQLAGVAISGLVQQSGQSLASINDNTRIARCRIGDLLLSMIVEDMVGVEEAIHIPGNAFREDRTVVVNSPTTDAATGVPYLTNDLERTLLKVVLDDVPNSPTYKAQQLMALSEAFKSMPPEYQSIALPHLLSLMDIPDKDEIVKAIRDASARPTPEQIQQQIDAAVQEALAKMRAPEIAAKAEMYLAQARKMDSEATNKAVEGMFSATQAAANIATQPAVAPLADALLQSAGFKDANAAPIIPPAQGVPAVPPPHNTNPLTPTNPAVGMNAGIEGGMQ